MHKMPVVENCAGRIGHMLDLLEKPQPVCLCAALTATA
jgi:hypothetical protein